MHPTTFDYLSPTSEQKAQMHFMRSAFFELSTCVLAHVPEGPDRTHLLRKLRECAMWANIAITRNPDGSPRG